MARFIVVGVTAALVHWSGVVILVSGANLRPAVANVPAWLLAFLVSFAGHHRWTFGDRQASLGRAIARFFLVSAAGFSVNELAYILALRWSPWPYDRVLAVVLVAVAGLTFLASRHWVFLRSEDPAPTSAAP